MTERMTPTGEYAWVTCYNQLLDKHLREQILRNPIGTIPIDTNRIIIIGTVVEDHVDMRRDFFERLSAKAGISKPNFVEPKFCEKFAQSFFIADETQPHKLSLPGLMLIGSFCRFKAGHLPGTMSIDEPHILTTFPYSLNVNERPIVLLDTLCQRYKVKNFFYNSSAQLP